jgi:hypothetical protein
MEIISPYDAEAHYSQKLTASGKKEWIGYRDHQSETCGDGPHVIVQVTTRPAPEQDIDALEQIHQDLVRQGFTDLEHFVDTGYITPESIDQAARTHGVVLTGPVRADPRAREHPGFTKADFTPNWQARTLTCPRGVTSHPWKATQGDGHERLSVLFPKPACQVCEARQECTGTTEDRGRAHHLAALAPAGDPDTGPTRTRHCPVAAALRDPGRLRSHRLRNRPCPRTAALPLPRHGQDPRPARSHRRRSQHHQAERTLHHHASPVRPAN